MSAVRKVLVCYCCSSHSICIRLLQSAQFGVQVRLGCNSQDTNYNMYQVFLVVTACCCSPHSIRKQSAITLNKVRML